MLEAEEAYEMAVADYDVSKAAGFPFYPTTQEMTYQIAYADEKVISVCRDLYVSSEGEAHPAVFLLSEQFDAVMGEKGWTFTDFFTDATPYGRGGGRPVGPAERVWPRRWSRGRSPGTPSPPRCRWTTFTVRRRGMCSGSRAAPCPHEQPALCGADLWRHEGRECKWITASPGRGSSAAW